MKHDDPVLSLCCLGRYRSAFPSHPSLPISPTAFSAPCPAFSSRHRPSHLVTSLARCTHPRQAKHFASIVSPRPANATDMRSTQPAVGYTASQRTSRPNSQHVSASQWVLICHPAETTPLLSECANKLESGTQLQVFAT